LSPDVTKYYDSLPSIEVDVAAVTDDEAKELKAAKVEDYFAPNSALRDKINPKTFYFTQEADKVAVLGSRDELWDEWLDNNPTTIVIIASLPPDDTLAKGAPDPRLLLVPMKKGHIIAPRLRICIYPKKIVIVSGKKDKKTAKKQKQKEKRKSSKKSSKALNFLGSKAQGRIEDEVIKAASGGNAAK
jgi:hypothetical protein